MHSSEEVFAISSRLVSRFYYLRDGMSQTNEQTLQALLKILSESNTKYAVIGGVAIQFWQRDPRTTLDVDIAVSSYQDLPTIELSAAGFKHSGRFPYSDNWIGPDGTPVQFTDDPLFALAISTAITRHVGEQTLRIAPALELVRAKLRSAVDAARRKSKRLQDLADVQALIEADPTILSALTEDERRLVQEP